VASAVSVIVPALDEEERIGAAVDHAFAAGAVEVIVADGGSSDATRDVARSRGAHVVTGERMRARQMNAAAATATGDVLLFLHADTLLPPSACASAALALEHGARFGGFLLAFTEHSLRLRLAAAMINARTRLIREPWGDQAQFIGRDAFLQAGGYREIPIMEDYELARRMRRKGPVAILPLRVRTSGRRFLKRGLLRTTTTNWLLIAGWHLGIAPEKLARIYRRQ
jgi:rSAM/selenodomain-associated transferase 2